MAIRAPDGANKDRSDLKDHKDGSELEMQYRHLKLHLVVIMKMARLARLRSRSMMRMITTMVVMLVTSIVDVDDLVREFVMLTVMSTV